MTLEFIKTDTNIKTRKISLYVLSFVLCFCLLIGVTACTSQRETEITNQTAGSGDVQEPQDSEVTPSINQSDNQGNGIEIGFTPDPEDTLSMQLLDKEINLDPFSDQDGFPVDTESGCDLIYETLLKWDPERLTYVPGLAELVNITGQGIEIKLREGAGWHDGRPVTPEQIEISLYWMSKHFSALSAAEGLIIDVMAKTDTDNQDTILLTLADPDDYHLALALDLLCRAPILPATLWSAGEDPLTITADELRSAAEKQPLGTGQWKVLLNDSFQLVLERQGDIDENKPRYLMLRKYADEAASERAIAEQEVDLLIGAGSDIIDGLKSYPGRSVLTGIRSNTDNDLLSNPLILNLLQLSIDTAQTGAALDDSAPVTNFWHYFGGITLVNSLRARLSNPAFAESYLDNKDDIAERLGGRIDKSGILNLNDNPVPALELILPEGDTKAEEACQAFADSARSQGLLIDLLMLPPEEYSHRLAGYQYDLAFVQTQERLESPLSLAEYFLHQWGEEKADMEPGGQEIILRLAAAITTEEFSLAAEEAFLYALTEMRFFPLGLRTLNYNYLATENWTNISQYWSFHQDNRDITGIGATAILDSITAKNQ